MAIKTEGSPKKETPQQNTQQNTTNQQSPNMGFGNTQSPQFQAPPIVDMFRQFSAPSQLVGPGREYRDQLVDLLKSRGGAPISAWDVTIDNRGDATVFSDTENRYGIALIFAETAGFQTQTGTSSETSPATLAHPVAEKFKQMTNGGQLIETIVVSKADYPKVVAMETHIRNALSAAVDPATSRLTIDQFVGQPLHISTDMNQVRGFINNYSPHGVAARDDIGFLVYFPMKSQHEYNKDQVIPVPMMAVTGYTEVYPISEAGPAASVKFRPMVHITDIVTPMPSLNLLPLALPLAAEIFVVMSSWLRPFSTYHEGDLNLGNLIPDPEQGGKPWFAKDQMQRDEFIRMYMTNKDGIVDPKLFLDVVEGRARIPGIDNYVYNSEGAAQNAANFLNVAIHNMPVENVIQTFCGTIMDEKEIDSRWVDYLWLIAKHKCSDEGILRKFAVPPMYPDDHAKKVRTIAPIYNPLYSNNAVAISPAFASEVAAVIKQKASIIYDQIGETQFINPNMGMNTAGFGSYNSSGFVTGSHATWQFKGKSPYEM